MQCDSPITARMRHGAHVLHCVVPVSLFHSNKLAINCRHSFVFDLRADIMNEL